jgi:arsenate reductase
MAEGLLRQLGGDRFEAASAGTQPSTVNPMAIRAMAELSIDISHHRSKSVDEMSGRQFDFVITVCDNARESCPVFPADVRMIHWGVEDPAQAAGSDEERIEVFRRVRDELAEHVRRFVDQCESI